MAWLGTWANRIQLAIDSSKVDSTLTNFPVTIQLNSSCGLTSADMTAIFDELTSDANRKKIAVTSSDGTTQLYVEIEKWDDTNETAVLHVKVPSVSSSANTVIYLYYDSAQSDNTSYVGDTTDAVTHNVWDSDFEAVYHMAQDPSGGSGAIKDSTSNANDGTPSGSMTTADLVSGKVGDGIEFDGSDDCINTNINPSYSVITVESVVKRNAAVTSFILGVCTTATVNDYLYAFLRDDGTIDGAFGGDTVSVSLTNDGSTLAQGSWGYAAWVGDGSNVTRYKDGTQTGTVDAETYSSCAVADDLYIGAMNVDGALSNYANATICEVRLSYIARSAAWIKATYNSLWDTLISYGINVYTTNESLVLTTYAATVAGTTNILANVASLSLTTYNADINSDILVNCSSETLVITAYNATVGININISCSVANLTITTNAATVSVVYYKDLTEEILFLSTIGFTWLFTSEETINIEDTLDTTLSWWLREYIEIYSTDANQWSYNNITLTESIRFVSEMTLISLLNETMAESLEVTDSLTGLFHILVSVVESLGIADTISPTMAYHPSMIETITITGAMSILRSITASSTETITIEDTPVFQWDENLSESITAADTIAMTTYCVLAIVESLTASDNMVATHLFTQELSETLEWATTLAIQQFLQLDLVEELDLSISVFFENEEWECWVLNTNQFHASVYSNFDFNSYAVFNGQAFGCKDDGIYRLDGDDDAGTTIRAGIVLPETAFGTSRQKRFRKAYFGISGTSPVIRMETDSGNQTYSISSNKANLSRGQKGQQWILKLGDFDDVDFIELVPIILTR